MDPLTARQVKNGVVYPTIRVASHPGKLLMGVFDGDDAYVDGTVLNRRAGEQGAPIPRDLFPDIAEADPSEAIYAGPLYFHFGHFLVESLARAWYASQNPDLVFVWAGQHTWQDTTLRPWQLEILDILGITNPTRIIADPTRFELLHVPDIGYRYDDWFHPEHAEFLRSHDGPPQEPGNRLWLSRSGIDSDARDLNTVPTEQRLAVAGWTVVHPQTLSVREQLDHLARAEVVAGEEGSAFHSAVLLRDLSAKSFRVLRRHGQEHPNMHTIGDARGMNQTFHSLERARVLRVEGRFVTKVSPNASEILDLLDAAIPDASGASRTADDARVLRVLGKARPHSIVDVGRPGPQVVLGSDAPVRVAVSPRFDFDPRAYTASGVTFYELAPETYADLFHADRDRFDVIAISGPDFDDVMQSFEISKRLAHANTVWIFGSGAVAARSALAVRLGHPGFTARRALAGFSAVYIVRQVPGIPATDAAVGRLPGSEVTRRARWIPPGLVSGAVGVSGNVRVSGNVGVRSRLARVLPGRVKRLLRRAQRRLSN